MRRRDGWLMRYSRSTRVRRALALCAGTMLAAGFIAVGANHAAPPAHPRFTSGSIWLTSRGVGQLTLVDGVSAKVAANVRVGAANSRFVATQADAAGYVFDADNGAVVGVSAATLSTVTQRLRPEERATVVYSVRGGVLAADAAGRTVTMLDGSTLRRVGPPVQLPSADIAFVGTADALWAVDRATGEVLAIDASPQGPVRRISRHIAGISGHGVRLTSAAGRPVLFDPVAHTAVWLAPDNGEAELTMQLPAGADDVVTGAEQRSTVLVMQAGSGVLYPCTQDGGGCASGIPTVPGGSDLGGPVVAGGYAFVPNYSTRTVWVAELSTGRVIHTEPLFAGAVRFELLTRSGIVYFNDPDTQAAGVIDADGTVRRIDKYAVRPSAAPSPSLHSLPSQSSSPTAVPTRSPKPSGSGSSRVPSPSSVPGPPSHISAISFDPKTPPEVGQTVTASATIAGPRPTAWAWSVVTADQTPEATGTEEQLKHTFTAPGRYTVTLTVTTGTRTDSLSATLTVITQSPRVQCGDVITRSVVLHEDLNCEGSGLTVGAQDVIVDLNDYTISGGTFRVDRQAGVSIRHGQLKTRVSYSNSPFGALIDVRVKAPDLTVSSSVNMRFEQSTIADTQITFNGSGNPSLSSTKIVGGALEFQRAETTSPLITGCVLQNTRLSFLVDVQSSNVVRSTITDTVITLQESDDLVVRDNTFFRSSVVLSQTSRRARFSNNEFTGADAVITVGDLTTDVVIEQNAFRNNRIGVADAARNIGETDGLIIRGNTFENNAVAGVYLDYVTTDGRNQTEVTGNHFTANGRQSAGKKDSRGRPVNDGLHITAPPGAGVFIADNDTTDNADYGIEAIPGTVTDGGGNRSVNNPSGCVGVRCT
ncbi:right-handed parallel beta-helix repeat-containing protein [Dactylosporangium sp. CA-092794]|uniref:right-handed parallel beta-helix repeat-containing protein n=1 Tax=Dactylosporangium sp. CA-092794 TaxID=3239929 RepID=UPI003D92FC15